MRRSELEKRINAALSSVIKEISGNAVGSHYARGLASEGYAGGYRDALNDVLLLLSDVPPNTRGYWRT